MREELDLFQRELCLQGKWQRMARKGQEPAKSEGKSSLLTLRGWGSGQVVGRAYTTRGGTLRRVSSPKEGPLLQKLAPDCFYRNVDLQDLTSHPLTPNTVASGPVSDVTGRIPDMAQVDRTRTRSNSYYVPETDP